MRQPILIATGCFLGTILCAPVWGAIPDRQETAVPGTLNYVEGQASIGSQALDSKSVGSAELQAGKSLTTEKGKAEILLTPGVFLRLDDNSSVEMISPGLTDTELRLYKGRATVEVAELHHENNLRIDEDGATTQLLKPGFYEFDADRNEIRVFDGKVAVQEGDKQVRVKGGRELTLNAFEPTKPQKFDKKIIEHSGLYRWSSLRSAYVAEANADAVPNLAMGGWFNDGWYWNPWFACYTFIPGDGIFYSPFGWGFYSPWLASGAPFYNYGHYYHRFDGNFHNRGPGPHYAGGPVGGHFHAGRGFGGAHPFGSLGGGGFRGGGFHGGGFHGGRERR